MKVAVLSESSADEAAIRILVEGVLSKPTQLVLPSSFRSRGGIDSVFKILPRALKELHYHTDADALVVVVDSDHSPVHQVIHEQPGGAEQNCRLCRLGQTITDVQENLTPVPGHSSVKTAIGVAVPAIEAWYLCGRNPQVSEAAWINGLQSAIEPYTRLQLKRDVYGTERPSLALETECAVMEAQRLAQDLSRIEKRFPNGFGSLARALRSW